MINHIVSAALLSALLAPAAQAQSEAPAEKPRKEPLRVRAGMGAQIVPRFPGSGDTRIGPFPDFAIARGSKEFDFEAPDESFGGSLLRAERFDAGVAFGIGPSRRRKDMDAPMDEVGTAFEAGGFVQYWLTPAVRVRAEGRKGIGGHRAWVGSVSADYVVRDGDRYVVSIGPRAALSDRDYQAAYFGVNAREAAVTGLPAYRPGSGVHAVGATGGLNYALGGRWGMVAYLRYDRLVGGAARSPFIRSFGSRDQYSGGVGLTYTFGRR